jgi:predicted enzyme related to lactoylglutathione lyase
MKAKDLGGIIISSPNPDKLAEFYKNVIGIPFKFQGHGNMPKHWECDYSNIHFAIIPEHKKSQGENSIVPSFVVDDIEEFIDTHELEVVGPILDLGESGFVAAVQDVDKNTIRLWTYNKAQ